MVEGEAGGSRRFAHGPEGRALARKLMEYVQAGDEAGFKNALHQLDLWEGDVAFERTMATYYELSRDWARRGRP